MNTSRELPEMVAHSRRVFAQWRQAWREGADLAWRLQYGMPATISKDDDE